MLIIKDLEVIRLTMSNVLWIESDIKAGCFQRNLGAMMRR